MSQAIVLATPIFLLMMLAEWWLSRRPSSRTAGRPAYGLSDAISSLSVGILSQLGGLFTKLFTIGIYTYLYNALWETPDAPLWSTWYGALLALLFYDFCYYWLHRGGHRVAVLWAAHVVHHQSQHYNLSTALRQTSSGALLGWLFYVPMAVAGVPPLLFGIVALVDLLYQFWVHTEQVGKLGWFDRVFFSPSNHRVHHAVNDEYLDKNYGGILVLWDRWFGTFKEEAAPCVYGTRGALNSWDPLWANAEVYWALMKDAWHTRSWWDKLRVWFKPPGWRPADVEARFPKPDFDIQQVQTFAPPVRSATQWFAGLQFVWLMAGVLVVLWMAGRSPLHVTAIWSGVLLSGFWALGAVLQGRMDRLEMLMIEAAAVATASGALGLLQIHAAFKPLALLLAISFIASRTVETRTRGQFDTILVWALVASLVGDVLLMLGDAYFIPGLVAFLVAHGFYIALFFQNCPRFPSRRALMATLGVGAAMLAWLWGGLTDPGLKVAVPVYVAVIALMAAQAIGRATVWRDGQAWAVAVGAMVFMLSDSLIAVNRFMQPLPLASLWVLSTYYLAQFLIVRNARPAPALAAQ
ncbi:lysoplasmalogenase family protein [Rhodoferax sp. PAMC 29310]|uniref:lysoplasmalogenase family protein n=1 Tax=Rhodoferax sp. PAMC 29310 TaxID=2822760 RepID=UPI001B32A0E5|nr:lysoplasmalogenase family protein [Rhodoferax sp. PAMC 29310]